MLEPAAHFLVIWSGNYIPELSPINKPNSALRAARTALALSPVLNNADLTRAGQIWHELDIEPFSKIRVDHGLVGSTKLNSMLSACLEPNTKPARLELYLRAKLTTASSCSVWAEFNSSTEPNLHPNRHSKLLKWFKERWACHFRIASNPSYHFQGLLCMFFNSWFWVIF